VSEPSHTHAALTRDGHRATITISTEAGLNIASPGFLSELDRCLSEIEAAGTAIREVVIQATGKVFVAGADIKAMSHFDESAAREMAELGHRVFDRLANLPMVTVAAIQGPALGGGCELALACDFRVAVNTAQFGQPEVLLGLIPGWGGTKRLFKIVTSSAARRMLFTGESIGVDQAARHGLIDELADSQESLPAYVDALLNRISKAGPQAIAALKQAIANDNEINMFARCFAGDESHAGIQAFLNKQPPPWAQR
jgi:enoyl-CoA hydratase